MRVPRPRNLGMSDREEITVELWDDVEEDTDGTENTDPELEGRPVAVDGVPVVSSLFPLVLLRLIDPEETELE